MHEVLVIHVVKGVGSVWVHVDGYSGVNVFGAQSLQCVCICSVECRVDRTLPAKTIYPVGKFATMRESNRVCR